MPMELGMEKGGLTDSIYMEDARLGARKQEERIARLVAMARRGQGQLTKAEIGILKKIRRERARHRKAQAAWQRKAAIHRAKIDRLIAQLEAAKQKPTGRFAKAASMPRITGKTRRRQVSRHRAFRAIR